MLAFSPFLAFVLLIVALCIIAELTTRRRDPAQFRSDYAPLRTGCRWLAAQGRRMVQRPKRPAHVDRVA